MSQIESRTVPIGEWTLDQVLTRVRDLKGFRAESNGGDILSLRREHLLPLDAYRPEPAKDLDLTHQARFENILNLFDRLSQSPNAHEWTVTGDHGLMPSGCRPSGDEEDVAVFQARRRGTYELGVRIGGASPLNADPHARQAFFEGLLRVLGWDGALTIGRDTEGRSVLLTCDDRFLLVEPLQAMPPGDERAAFDAGRTLISVGGTLDRDELGVRMRDFDSIRAQGVPAEEFGTNLAAVLDYVGRVPAGPSFLGCLVRPEAYERFRETVAALDPTPTGWEVMFWSGRSLSVDVILQDEAIESTVFPWGQIKRGRKPPIDIDIDFERSDERPFVLCFSTRDPDIVLEEVAGELVGDPSLIDRSH